MVIPTSIFRFVFHEMSESLNFVHNTKPSSITFQQLPGPNILYWIQIGRISRPVHRAGEYQQHPLKRHLCRMYPGATGGPQAYQSHTSTHNLLYFLHDAMLSPEYCILFVCGHLLHAVAALAFKFETFRRFLFIG